MTATAWPCAEDTPVDPTARRNDRLQRAEKGQQVLLVAFGAGCKRGPRAVVVTIPGCGHAPALNVPDQVALVERFLNGR